MVKREDREKIRGLYKSLKKDYALSCIYYVIKGASVVGGAGAGITGLVDFVHGEYLSASIKAVAFGGCYGLYDIMNICHKKVGRRIERDEFRLEIKLDELNE